jgi:coenzyme F420-0:L-glutamate ligase/coenzyme F420-1:gamma-L-glutamate ligase
MLMSSFSITTLPNIPLIKPGDDLVTIILDSLRAATMQLQAGDVLIVTSKIVSKAEGRYATLSNIAPGPEAESLGDEIGKDPRLVELILCESRSVSRKAPGVLVTEHRLGFVSANSGIDHSNVEDDVVLLLPLDPDLSARKLRQGLYETTSAQVGIVISDSHGRPFRLGTVGIAIGVAGMPALLDLRGQTDLYGRELMITMQGYADMIASAAQLVSSEGAEGRPVALLRGLEFPDVDGQARDLLRPREQDLYR